MDVILVPGLWLDAASWDPVAHALRVAGHRPTAVTLPGVGEPAPVSAQVEMSDWVGAIVQHIDESDGPVVLVGHSGGGNVIWGAADARPEQVHCAIFVDTIPPAPDSTINEFPIVDGVIPFPGWDFFPDEDVFDLDTEVRERASSLSRSVPAKIPTDPITLTRESRHGVPVTLLMGSHDQAAIEGAVDRWGAYGEEYRAIASVEVVKIGSGHWPQFSIPERLSAQIIAAIDAGSVPHSETTVDGDDRA